jgi:hypothetical protein
MTAPNIPVLEGYPDHILARIEARDRGLRRSLPTYIGGVGFDLVFEDLKTWKTGTLRVGFTGGTKALRTAIADLARSWTEFGAISFEFKEAGDFEASDECHIRVSFDQPGYWSLVGTDSVDPEIVGFDQASLNLSGFDEALPPDWAGTVLHEFGHALGFHHEHQSPVAHCDFDWDLLYDYLSGPPNYWSRAKVDHNLRQLPGGGLTFSPHDKASIMHYSFPDWMFKMQAASPCYTARNSVLSETDKQMMARAYPRTEPLQTEMTSTKIAHLTELLAADGIAAVTRSTFTRHLRFLNS